MDTPGAKKQFPCCLQAKAAGGPPPLPGNAQPSAAGAAPASTRASTLREALPRNMQQVENWLVTTEINYGGVLRSLEAHGGTPHCTALPRMATTPLACPTQHDHCVPPSSFRTRMPLHFYRAVVGGSHRFVVNPLQTRGPMIVTLPGSRRARGPSSWCTRK